MNIEACLTPRLRLFLSVDLVGSTKLKQRGSFPIAPPKDDQKLHDMGAAWFSPVAGFYQEFEKIFSLRWDHYENRLAPDCKWTSGPSPFLWKTNGDELLYVKEITAAHQVYACIKCWIEAVHSYRQLLNGEGNLLDVKATAWLAGFPIANHEIIFSKEVSGQSAALDFGLDPLFNHLYSLDKWYQGGSEKAGLTIDFIGPSIDTGFRLSQFATPRKFPISVDLALMLASVTPPAEMDGKIKFYFDGKYELKGVLDGKPYPIFWIDMLSGNPLTVAEDSITKITASVREEVVDYSRLFIETNSKFMFEPFVWESTEISFVKRPDNYDRKLEALNDRWLHEKRKFEIENSSVSGESPPDSDKVAEQTASSEDIENLEKKIEPRNS